MYGFMRCIKKEVKPLDCEYWSGKVSDLQRACYFLQDSAITVVNIAEKDGLYTIFALEECVDGSNFDFTIPPNRYIVIDNSFRPSCTIMSPARFAEIYQFYQEVKS